MILVPLAVTRLHEASGGPINGDETSRRGINEIAAPESTRKRVLDLESVIKNKTESKEVALEHDPAEPEVGVAADDEAIGRQPMISFLNDPP
jgi:hypothetical protein